MHELLLFASPAGHNSRLNGRENRNRTKQGQRRSVKGDINIATTNGERARQICSEFERCECDRGAEEEEEREEHHSQQPQTRAEFAHTAHAHGDAETDLL